MQIFLQLQASEPEFDLIKLQYTIYISQTQLSKTSLQGLLTSLSIEDTLRKKMFSSIDLWNLKQNPCKFQDQKGILGLSEHQSSRIAMKLDRKIWHLKASTFNSERGF